MRKVGTIEKMTPGSAIRAFCVSCCGGVVGGVRSCDANGNDPAFRACPFHPYRMGRGRASVKTIRKLCLQCMGDNRTLVGECEITDCPCNTYRMGKNPARTGKGYFANQDRTNLAEIIHVNGHFPFHNRRTSTG